MGAIHRWAVIIHVAFHREVAIACRSRLAAEAVGDLGYPGWGDRTVTLEGESRRDIRPWTAIDIAAAVTEFHAAFRLPVQQMPTVQIDPALASLRIALLKEETSEFVIAAGEGDLIGIADALADIVYVAYGTALAYGTT